MKSGQGSCSTNRTVCGSTTATSLTFCLSCAPLARPKLNLTSSAVNASPLWNLTSLRSLNSYTSLSGLSVQDSARLGVIRLPGIGFTRASCSAYIIQNGVRFPGPVSPGSSHAGAIVTYTANRISPSGLVCAATEPGSPAEIARQRSAAKPIFRQQFIAAVPPLRLVGYRVSFSAGCFDRKRDTRPARRLATYFGVASPTGSEPVSPQFPHADHRCAADRVPVWRTRCNDGSGLQPRCGHGAGPHQQGRQTAACGASARRTGFHD